MNSLLEIKNLTTEFHTESGILKAVNDVSFTLSRGKPLASWVNQTMLMKFTTHRNQSI